MSGYKAFKNINRFNNQKEPTPKPEDQFIDEVIERIENPEAKKYNWASLKNTAKKYGSISENDRLVKELAETAIVMSSRKITLDPTLSPSEKYEKLVAAYANQVNLSLRTSTSILLQQYSTPAPLGYLMGLYIGAEKPFDKASNSFRFFYEPSAGNGMLTIAGEPKRFYVNEIDDIRFSNLNKQGYAAVFREDASIDQELGDYASFFGNVKFDGIVTNPPFEPLDPGNYITFGGYEIRDLDHVMVIRALNLMKDTGKAAIIVGSHTKWDKRGVIIQGKNLKFLSYLYKNYNVEDIILFNGDLYSKMGTSFDTRIILINGRKPKPEGYAPNKDQTNTDVVNTFEDLYARFDVLINKKADQNDSLEKLLLMQKQKIVILALKYKYNPNPQQ
jgi:hypothetical protein